MTPSRRTLLAGADQTPAPGSSSATASSAATPERVTGHLDEADLRRDGQALDEPSVRLGEVALRERDAREREAHVRDAVAVADARCASRTVTAVARARSRSPVCSYDSARLPSTISRMNSSPRASRRPSRCIDRRLRIAGGVLQRTELGIDAPDLDGVAELARTSRAPRATAHAHRRSRRPPGA